MQSPRQWAIEHFGGAELDDLRRIDRAITIGEAMAASPGKSLPQIFAHPYDLKAAYTFFRQPEVTPDNLQAGHRELVLCEMEKPGRYDLQLRVDPTANWTDLPFKGCRLQLKP